MTETVPTTTLGLAARQRPCPLCYAPPGTPCRRKPPGDHLARYLDTYTAGRLTSEYVGRRPGRPRGDRPLAHRPGRCWQETGGPGRCANTALRGLTRTEPWL
jgi:hypothetical protein